MASLLHPTETGVFQGHFAVDCQSDKKVLQCASHFSAAVSSRRLEDRGLS